MRESGRFPLAGRQTIRHDQSEMKSLLPVLALGLLLAALVFAARCSQDRMHEFETRRDSAETDGISTDNNTAPNDLAEQDLLAELFPDTLSLLSGIRFKILREGEGPLPVAGNHVRVHYTGRLLDGTVFDSSYARDEPFEFRLLAGEVIRGWDQSVKEMRPGEKRLVVIPSRLAYGLRGRPPVIPARAPLVFEIELISSN